MGAVVSGHRDGMCFPSLIIVRGESLPPPFSLHGKPKGLFNTTAELLPAVEAKAAALLPSLLPGRVYPRMPLTVGEA